MDNPQEMLEKVSLAAKFANKIDSSDFANEIDKRLNVQKALLAPVKDAVETETLSVVDGLAIASCISGRLYGYEEFHGNTGRTVIDTLARPWQQEWEQQPHRTPVAT